MASNPRVLLLDEPTSILAPSEVGELFAILESLRDNGTAIVIVTHKLQEVMRIADRVVVMAKGAVNGDIERQQRVWPEGVERTILNAMFEWDGQPEGETEETGQAELPHATAALEVSRLATNGSHAGRRLHDVTFDLPSGTITALIGIDGHGQHELAEAICGYVPTAGKVLLDGNDLSSASAVDRAGAGIALLVDDRLGEAAIGSFTIAENLVLKRPRPRSLSRARFFRRDLMRSRAREVILGMGRVSERAGYPV